MLAKGKPRRRVRAAGEAGGQVEYPPLHGNVTDQLFARSLGKTMGLSETEHLLDRFLVGEAGDVVERLALSRLETGAVRVDEVEGGHMGHDVPKGIVPRTSRHEVPG